MTGPQKPRKRATSRLFLLDCDPAKRTREEGDIAPETAQLPRFSECSVQLSSVERLKSGCQLVRLRQRNGSPFLKQIWRDETLSDKRY